MTVLIILGSLAGILSFVINLLRYLKIKPENLKQFITIRGRAIAWTVYLIIAALLTVYFLSVLSTAISLMTFSFELATLLVLLIWGLLGTWAPAIKRLRNKRINIATQIFNISLVTLTVLGFWKIRWPEIQESIFVTLLYLAFIISYVVDKIRHKRKVTKPAGHIN